MMDLSVDQLVIEAVQLKKGALTYRAINHSLRLQILNTLHRNTEMNVTALNVKLRLEQSVASQHLAILRKAALAINRRDGKNVFYSVNHQRLKQLHTIAAGLISKPQLY